MTTLPLLGTRRGFALPSVILVMFVLVGALAAGFTMMSGERAADDAQTQAQAALALAETGLGQGLRNRAGLGLANMPPAAGDSVRLTLSGGYADIITTQLRAPTSTLPGLYLIRARGTRTTTGVSGGGNASQTVTQIATFQRLSMTVQGAMVGINGVHKNGASGDISGADHGCSPAAPTVPGAYVPTSPGVTGNTSSISGSPAIGYGGANAAAMAASTPIDWDGIVNRGAIPATFELTSPFTTGFPSAAWWTANPNNWPTIIVKNGPNPSTTWQLPRAGRGLLIVFGNLDLNGNTAGWDGVILVGGYLTSNGSNQVAGSTVTGLNVKLGYTVPNSDILNGTKDFFYSSCSVANALSGAGSMREYRNTWTNSFPAY